MNVNGNRLECLSHISIVPDGAIESRNEKDQIEPIQNIDIVVVHANNFFFLFIYWNEKSNSSVCRIRRAQIQIMLSAMLEPFNG